MPDQADQAQLRTRIRFQQIRRRSLESMPLRPQEMIAASLVERFLGSGDRRRRSPAYYLSRSLQGRSKLIYVKQGDLAAVRRQCQGYHAFRENLSEWRRLGRELETLWAQLLEAQSR